MTLNKVRENHKLTTQRSARKVSIRKTGIPFASSCALMPLATVCFMLAGASLVAPSALSQDVARSTPSAVTPNSTCAIESQGLMCNVDQHELETPSASSQASINAASLLQPSTNAQMEQLSNVLLGFLYFVLPVGFGLGLFLHDRYQAYRSAMLDAQIKLLEKLWEQSPQA